MDVCFFGISGHVPTIPLEDRWTVTADWYRHHYLPKVFEVRYQHCPEMGLCGLFLHHDNTSIHTAATMVDFLNESEVQLLPCPPYSPDLSPCNFLLFWEVKNNWRIPCLRALKMHVERSQGLLKTYSNQPGLRCRTSSFTAWQNAKLLKEDSLKKWSNSVW